MEILKNGILPDSSRYFRCPNCGAIWKADKSEYTSNVQYNETYYMSDCPTKGCNSLGRNISEQTLTTYGVIK